MKPSTKLKIAGVLDMVTGSLAVVISFILLAGGITTLNVPGGGALFLFIAVIFAVAGIPAVIGGIYTLRRKRWRRAFVCSLFAIPLWGVGAITAMMINSAKDEFS